MDNKTMKSNYTTIHVPDPCNLGKFISVTYLEDGKERISCRWCKSKYSTDRHESCPNCGGPQDE